MSNPSRKNVSSKKNFIIKEKSISSLHQKHFSVSDLNSDKQRFTLTHRVSKFQPDSEVEKKNDQITLLKRKLDTALHMAISQKILASSNREQVFKDQKTKGWYESKIIQLENIILRQRDQHRIMIKQKKSLQERTEDIKNRLQIKQSECLQLLEKTKQIDKLRKQITQLTLITNDLQPLKQKIKSLQIDIRKQKIAVKDNSKQMKLIQSQRNKLLEELKLQKPHQQELKQRIAYLQRVNLDLSRKMQDYDRRQNEYIRQANILKRNIKKLSDEKAALEQKLFDTSKNLADKISQCQALQIQSDGKSVMIQNLQIQLKGQKQKIVKLIEQLQATKQFYKQQQIENAELNRKNKYLLQHQTQYERVLTHFQRVNDEINLTIIARSQQIKKLHAIIQTLQRQSTQLQEKFNKFQILFQDQNQKVTTQIKEFFYLHIRENTKLKIINHQLTTQMADKVLKYGQQRDAWVRKNQIRASQTPSDQQLFGRLYHQKNQQLILLQGSNDQLLKIKKQLQDRIRQLQNQVEQQKRQSISLKLKASQVFKAKRQVEQAKKTMQRYQQMIAQQNDTTKDLESQLLVLRQKINLLNQKNFHLDLNNKNYIVKIKQLQDIMTEINADVLIQRKSKNDMNAHMINDSLDKLQNGVKSLEFYFSCSFCGEIPPVPITLSPCGHTYCQKAKCKEAYTEFCFECDTGMPIDNAFTNKYMKQAMSKFKFFKIVIEEATASVKSLLKDI